MHIYIYTHTQKHSGPTELTEMRIWAVEAYS